MARGGDIVGAKRALAKTEEKRVAAAGDRRL